MLNLYSFFHLNLMYSSIPLDKRKTVINNCYWPLLRLCEELDVPLGLEVTGLTLEKINELDPEWIKKLKELIKQNKCELIGSGYAQVIGPLVPAKVNDWNQKLGLKVYKDLLGVEPAIALVSEMAYSVGIVEHYLNHGYKAIIMEWNNPRRCHPEWENEWRYHPQMVKSLAGGEIAVVWADSIAFQKFQRYAHGEYCWAEYYEYLTSHLSEKERFFSLYSNDVEIFDFRPGRYHTEALLGTKKEWQRIFALFEKLGADSNFSLVLPSQILFSLGHEFAGNVIRLESAQQPIPVKKQEKYNINRWALTGRADLEINTKCFEIYATLERLKNTTAQDWQELCYLWSSDFRTHIGEKRWQKYQERLDCCYKKVVKPRPLSLATQILSVKQMDKAAFQYHEDDRWLIVESKTIKCIFNKLKGLAIDKLWFKNVFSKPLLGTLPHGYYDEISFGADFFSGHLIIEKEGQHKITDLVCCQPLIVQETNQVLRISFSHDFNGGIIKKEYQYCADTEELKINTELVLLQGRKRRIIHPLNLTFLPTGFERESVVFATHNGGNELEVFPLEDQLINHAQSLSALISAKHGLGATQGLVVVGDRQKQLLISHDQSESALIPSVYYVPMGGDQYFLRLQYSAQELDETFVENDKEQRIISKYILRPVGNLKK